MTDEDMPMPLTLSGLDRKSVAELQSLLAAFGEDLSDGRQFDSSEDEFATRNWYLQIKTEMLRRSQ